MSNIALLIIPRCSQHIWMKLKASTLKADLHLSHVGEEVANMLVANTTLVTCLTSLKNKVHSETKKEVKATTN